MGLWIVLLVMTAVAALILLAPMFVPGRRAAPVARSEIAVYADQLTEVERDLDRGVIGAAEAAAAKTEISRRILRADERRKTVTAQPARRTRIVAGILILFVVPLVSLGLYLELGSPRLPDEPLAERKATPVDKLSPEELIARLDERLAANPNDVKGWDIAGPIYMRTGRFADAVNAFQSAIRLGGPDVRRETGLGEALTASAQGIVTSDARAAFEVASKIDPHFPLPKMYLALALSQDGRLQESADAWKAILASAEGHEPWVAAARKELAGVEAKLAEANGQPAPPQPSDPPQAEAAPDPAAQTMIQSMVARLAERLDRQGGTAEEWGRLIKSDLVLGRTDDAKAAYDKAKSALVGDAAATAQLDAIAVQLGLPQ